jgi:hypothetical protein
MDSSRLGQVDLRTIVEQVLEVLRSRGLVPPGGDSASLPQGLEDSGPQRPSLGLCTAGPPSKISSAQGDAASSGPEESSPSAPGKTDLPSSLASQPVATSSPSQSGFSDGELFLRKRVITLSDVAEYLPKLRRLIVPPRAILSPAVVDELTRRSVTVDYSLHTREPVPVSPTSSEKPQLTIEVVSRRFEPEELIAHLSREGITVRSQQGDCLVAATKRLAQAMPLEVPLGAVLTRHAPLAVCLANRHRNLRATWASSVNEMLEHVRDLGANVLVLELGKLSVWQLVQILAQFVRLGPQPCPIAELPVDL